jgi:hypothetical protein
VLFKFARPAAERDETIMSQLREAARMRMLRVVATAVRETLLSQLRSKLRPSRCLAKEVSERLTTDSN